MKIKNLIQKLNKLNPNSEVIVSSDAEGNNYSLLFDISCQEGLRYSKNDDEIILSTRNDIDGYYFTEKEYNKGKDCVVLYPN